MTTAEILAELPGYVLGLGADGLTPEQVRDRLAAIGNDDPETGHRLADQLALTALRLIANGHPDPAGLAQGALTVVSAEFPRRIA